MHVAITSPTRWWLNAEKVWEPLTICDQFYDSPKQAITLLAFVQKHAEISRKMPRSLQPLPALPDLFFRQRPAFCSIFRRIFNKWSWTSPVSRALSDAAKFITAAKLQWGCFECHTVADAVSVYCMLCVYTTNNTLRAWTELVASLASV